MNEQVMMAQLTACCVQGHRPMVAAYLDVQAAYGSTANSDGSTTQNMTLNIENLHAQTSLIPAQAAAGGSNQRCSILRHVAGIKQV